MEKMDLKNLMAALLQKKHGHVCIPTSLSDQLIEMKLAHPIDGDLLARRRAKVAPGAAVDLGAWWVRRFRSGHQCIFHRDEDLSWRSIR